MTKFLCALYRILSWEFKLSIIEIYLTFNFHRSWFPGHWIPQTLAEHDTFKADFKADITEAVKDAI